MRFLIILVAITLTCTSCKGQKKSNQQNTTTMTQGLDTFDISTFNKYKKGTVYTFYNHNKDFVTQEYRDNYYIERVSRKKSKYCKTNVFNNIGVIIQKGEYYDSNLHLGLFKWYDSNGNITKVKDFDKYYTFTLEDVLEYCKENNLVDKDVLGFTKKAKVTLARTDSSNLTETDSIQWSVMYGPVPYTPKGATRVFSVVLWYV